MRLHRFVFLAAFGIVVFSAGSLAADPRVVHALLWTDGEGHSLNHALEAGIEDFEQSHQGRYSVDPEWVLPADAETRLDALLASGSAPDLFMTDAVNLKRRVANGNALALDDAIAADPAWGGRFPRPLLDLLRSDGHLYAVPIAQTGVFLYYNTEIFRTNGLAVPRMWEDLSRAVQVLSGKGITPIAFSNKEGWEGVLLSQVLAERIGGPDVFAAAPEGKLDAALPALLEAGKMLGELVRQGAFPANFRDMTETQATALFTHGKAGMLISRERLFATLDFSGSAVKKKVGLVPFPLLKNGRGDAGSWVASPDFDLAVSPGSANREGALELIKTYMSDDLQLHFAAHIFLPVTRTGLDPEQLVPLQRTAVGLLSGMTQASLFLDQVLPRDVEARYAEAVQAILAGVAPIAALAALK
jgi:ABC-type glycerol-3-phosphate transport system substrate-binding protein